MKYLLLVLLFTSLHACESNEEHKREASVHIQRFSVDHKVEAEGLRGELERTKSEHERQVRQDRCKIITSFFTAAAGVLGGVGSIIYSVKKCN